MYINIGLVAKKEKLRRTTQCAGVYTQSHFGGFESSNKHLILVIDFTPA